ncbi:MAG: TerD family protein [Bacteroidetes bacterium]|nr:TerD family protein [Bacteroidota bacterium]
MALNLNKGSRFNLAKEAPALKVAGIGLGWDPNEEENGPDFDLDVSAFLITADGKVPADEYVVFYGSQLLMDTPEGKRPYSGDSAVLGAVDAKDGTESDGEDDEDMRIYFDKVWEGIQQIVITVSITKYPNDSKKDKRTLLQNFGMVNDCYIRVWDDESQTEILRYNLKEQFTNEDAVEFGRFVRVGDSWEFIATGEKYNGSLMKFIELFT